MKQNALLFSITKKIGLSTHSLNLNFPEILNLGGKIK